MQEPEEITREEMDELVQYMTSTVLPNTTITVVALVLESGYVVTGEAACFRPETFDRDRGVELATEKAFRNLARLLSFHKAMLQWLRDEDRTVLLDPSERVLLKAAPDLLRAAQKVDKEMAKVAATSPHGPELNGAWAFLRYKIGEAAGEVAPL